MEKTCIISGALLAAFFVFGCGKSEELPPQTPQQQSPYAQPQNGYGGQPSYGGPQNGYGGQPAAGPENSQLAPGQIQPLGAILADPNAMQGILAGALAGGAAALGSLTGGEQAPIEQGIKMQAQTQAKGKQPDGQLLSARLQQDGHAEGSLTMQPGACYTVIGFGGLGVMDYQVNLVTAPPLPPQVLAQSPTGGVAPVVGPNDQCIRSPYPLPLVVKVDMHLLRGQGLVGAQVYKK
jgi:hypothetical protein